MTRRDFTAALGSAVVWPLAARAQQPKMLRVGYSGIMPREAPHYAAFEKRMAELGFGEPPDYVAALMPMVESPDQPIMIPASPLFLRDRATIAQLLLDRHTPSICAFREVMEAGALISYGVNLVDVFRDVADFVDQLARGANASDVPMREPSHFHIAFNLQTAKALGIDILPQLLARADEVIE
jgi:hypothetical protein